MSAEATFYDGASARAWLVSLRFADALEIVSGDAVLARWPYEAMRRREAPPGVLRLGLTSGPDLARLDVTDLELQQQLALQCHDLDRDREGRGGTWKIVGWSVAAAASLVLTAIFLVPLAAERLAGLVPMPLERRLGAAVDNQVRSIFGAATCSTPAGDAALAKLTGELVRMSPQTVRADVAVLRSAIPNAIALPGQRVYLFDGLLRRAENPDEIAGVLAHELGHVAHRDGLKRLLQTGGTSFLLGLLFGDVTGGAAIIIAARTMIDGSYSRDAERRADAFAADTLLALGRSPQPMGFLLRRIEPKGGVVPPFLSSHPVTEERLQALGARPVDAAGPPLLSDEEWGALRGICRQD
jgi:predicted Zn-dependent protease